MLREIGPTSYMCVPLIARGRAFGAMSFTITDSGRTFGQEDLDLAFELSRRTAVAIDNAIIYRRSIALRLEAEAAGLANINANFFFPLFEHSDPVGKILDASQPHPPTGLIPIQVRKITAARNDRRHPRHPCCGHSHQVRPKVVGMNDVKVAATQKSC